MPRWQCVITDEYTELETTSLSLEITLLQNRNKLPVRFAEEWRLRHTISFSLVLTHYQLFNYV